MKRQNHNRILTRLPAFLMLIVLLTSSLGGWGRRPHATITKSALDVLPEWEKRIWKEQIPNIIEEYCLIPDFYLRRPEFAGYAILDDYDVIFSDYTYKVTKTYLLRNGHFHLPDKQRENFRLYEHFFERIVSSLKDDRIDDAAKFAGVMLHVIEDYSAPSHSAQGDNQFFLFKQFLPPPEKFKYARLHSLIEYGDVSVDILQYKPRLLGTSPSEVAFRMLEKMNNVIIAARGKVIPIIQAIYNEDERSVQANNSEMAEISARVAADMIHSAFCIAYDKFDQEQKEDLHVSHLSDLIPLETIYLAWRQPRLFRPVYGGAPTSGVILDKEGQPLPLTLKYHESRKLLEKKLDRGIAAGTRRSMVQEPCVLSYIVPEGVFERFEAVVGIHSRLGEEGSVIFQVKGDDKVLFDSGPLTRDDPARNISVSLQGVKEIQLITFSGTKDHPYNYPVWGEPRLVKKRR